MFAARFTGNCGSCLSSFSPGTSLRYSEGQYIHADCLDILPPIERKPAAVCRNCFIEKPCECDD